MLYLSTAVGVVDLVVGFRVSDKSDLGHDLLDRACQHSKFRGYDDSVRPSHPITKVLSA